MDENTSSGFLRGRGFFWCRVSGIGCRVLGVGYQVQGLSLSRLRREVSGHWSLGLSCELDGNFGRMDAKGGGGVEKFRSLEVEKLRS